MNTTTEAKTIPEIIAAQIGSRAFFMMGTNQKIGDGATLAFNVRGARETGCNKIRVTLCGDDTYCVEFWRVPVGARAIVAGKAPVLLHHSEGVYADGLHQCIEYHTGLALSL
jgi:hypothetical protein